MTRRIISLAAGAVLLLGAAGCSANSTVTSAESAPVSPSAAPEADQGGGNPAGGADSGSKQDPNGSKAGGGQGTINDVVPSRTQETLPPVSRDQKAPYGTGVSARVTGTKPVTIKGKGPGEMSGDGYAVTIEFVNGSGKSVDLDQVVVAATYGPDALPAEQTVRPPTKPVRGSLAAGKTASGTYAFVIPAPSDQVQVLVSYSTDAPVVAIAL